MVDWGIIIKIGFTLLGGYVVLLSWIGRDYIQKIKDNSKKIVDNEKSIEEVKGSHKLYEEKFSNLKEDLTEIKADIKTLLTKR